MSSDDVKARVYNEILHYHPGEGGVSARIELAAPDSKARATGSVAA